jgi:hypothetical protein
MQDKDLQVENGNPMREKKEEGKGEEEEKKVDKKGRRREKGRSRRETIN